MRFTPSLIFTIILFIILYGLIFIFLQGRLPDAKTIIAWIENLYRTYGYIIIFGGAILEGTFLVGNYVPGSAVILLGAALSKNGTVQFPLIILFGVLGLNVAYTINYFLGRHGWYHILSRFGLQSGLDVAKNRMHENILKAIFIGYIAINIAALISTSAGILKIRYPKFIMLSLVAQGFWSFVWGSTAYYFGYQLVEIMLKYFVAFTFAIGLVWIIIHASKKL